MKKIPFTVLILITIVIGTAGCKKTCECTQWTNNQEGQSYTVDLESDGTICQDYTQMDTVNDMINGVICVEQAY
ncbi:MAG TPA: hypothetical protein PLI77_04750 [Bacteroidales bacterium]|jgi:hypothetical protein|nr:hypothetical protein [Bacteroidales bacterium]HPE40380.1 hypothetical protein [Bacteroidales bacterium]